MAALVHKAEKHEYQKVFKLGFPQNSHAMIGFKPAK
jgi:hypothetical protein